MSERETELMLALKDGSQAAFEEIYEVYRKPLANFLYRLCWNRSLVDDLVQEVMMRIWRSRASYEPVAKVSTYIFRIATNYWINESAKRREQAMEGADRAIDGAPSDSLEQSEVQKAVRKAVDGLPEGERLCLILSEYNGLKYQQISDIMSIPVGTVKSRIFSAMKHLKESLKDQRVQ